MIKRIQNIFKYLFFQSILFVSFFCFLWALLSSFFHSGVLGNINLDYVSINKVLLFFFVFVFLGLFFFFYYFLKKKHLSNNILWIISGFLFLLFFLCQVWSFQLMVDPTWDFSILYHGAIEVVTGNLSGTTWAYLSQFPNNIILFVMEVLSFFVANFLGFHDYLMVGVLINVFFIDLAVLFLFLYLKKNHSFSLAIMGLLFCLLLTPLFLYTPIFYSDTFAVFAPIFLLYCYSFLRGQTFNRKHFLFFFLLAFVSNYGMRIKMTTFITTIAIVIDMLFQGTWKQFWKGLGFFAISFLGCFLLFQFGENYVYQHYQLSKDLKMPYTHWVMMGMHGNGGYSAEDYDIYPQNSTVDEKIQLSIQNIKNTLSDYGVKGYLSFLNNKVFYTYGDGTYFVSLKLTRKPFSTESLLSQIVLVTGRYHRYYLYFANTIHYALLFLTVLSILIAFLKKDYKIFHAILSIMGLFLFLLFWETRSRYLYHYIPVFVLVSLVFLEQFELIVCKRLSNYKKIREAN